MAKLNVFDIDGTTISAYMETKQPFGEVEVLPTRVEKLAKILAQGDKIAFASNQGGIAFGYNTEADVQAKFKLMLERLELPADTPIAVCYAHEKATVAGYNDPAQVARRKPSGAMILELMAQTDVTDPAEVLMVGDRPEDQNSALAAGVAFRWSNLYFSDVSRAKKAKKAAQKALKAAQLAEKEAKKAQKPRPKAPAPKPAPKPEAKPWEPKRRVFEP